MQIPGCHVRRPGPGECGKPSVYRYAAMGGGWAYCCDGHGKAHESYAERLVNAQWVAPPPLPPLPPSNREQARRIRTWLTVRGHDYLWLARATGYAPSTARQWLSGYALSRPVAAKLRKLGIRTGATRGAR